MLARKILAAFTNNYHEEFLIAPKGKRVKIG
jgi:hypothetical protein